MRRAIPTYIPLITPTTSRTASDVIVTGPSDVELHRQLAQDPVVGDTVTCADLQRRERDCWREYDRRWPPRNGLPPQGSPDRERAIASHRACRRRGQALLRLCRVTGVRAG